MPGNKRYSDKIRLIHARDAVLKIQDYIGKKNKSSFKKNEMLQDACIRQLQVIGEACNTVSKATQKSHPEIEWAQISGLRNIVVHEYFGVDAEIIWNIIKSDLPAFLKNVVQIIESLPD
jgi:uncharacterized protein with HEPN domain